MIVVYPKYFIMPVVIDNDINFTNDNKGFRSNGEVLDEQVINVENDEFFQCDNDFIKSEIE